MSLGSKKIGESWRIWAAKRIKRISGLKNVKVRYELPKLYFTCGGEYHDLPVPLSSPSEYKRQVRQGRQTARKAGITDVDARNVKLYPEEHKEYFARLKREGIVSMAELFRRQRARRR